MKTRKYILLLMLSAFLVSCITKDDFVPDQEVDDEELALTIPVSMLSEKQLMVQGYVKPHPIIANRGTEEYAPENTAAAYKFARQVGTDYILVDLQMTNDNFLVGFRNDLDNHSNINTIYPGFDTARPNDFSLPELKLLDVGSWYSNGTYDRAGYVGLKVLTLEEIINICEGKLEDGSPDPADSGNRPGIYFRLYQPWLNPGIEEALKTELMRLGWYADDMNNLKVITTTPGKIDVANTKGRVVISTLEQSTVYTLEETFKGNIPFVYWLWKSSNYIKVDDATTYAEFINFGIDHGAQFIGPNVSTNDLLQVWQSNLIRRTDARIQGYNINTKANMAKYTFNDLSTSEGNVYQLEYDLTDGFTGNRPQYATYFYGKYYLPTEDRTVPAPPFYSTQDIKDVFEDLGY